MNLDPRLSKLLADAERRWGRGALVRWGDVAWRPVVEVIHTGFPALDAALGIGGLPCGRISEIFGPDSSGKHALAAHLAVQCQRAEGVVAYVDAGRRLDTEQMRAQGVEIHSLLVARPRDHLQGLEMAIRLARSGGIRLMILDLANALTPTLSQRERATPANRGHDLWLVHASGMFTSARGAYAPLDSPASGLRTQHSALSLALRRLVSAVDRNGIALVFLSTQRSGSGQALRFFASVRLGLERREWIRRGRDVVGCRTLVQVAKNKLAPPLKDAEVELLFYRFPLEAPPLQIAGSGIPARARASGTRGDGLRAAARKNMQIGTHAEPAYGLSRG